MDVVVKSATELREIAEKLLIWAEAPRDVAATVAESLVLSNLKGLDSHGIIKVPAYLQKIRNSELYPGARPVLSRKEGATATVDAGWGFGQTAGRFAVEAVIDIAREFGVGTVAVSRCNHVGRTGEYVERIAQQGFVGVAVCSGANPGGSVAPYGGARRLFGTNPIAWGVPRSAGEPPIISDFATSAIAAGKLDVYLHEGRPAPNDALIDAEGRESTDPRVFFDDGALLPFGRQKGYAINLLIEILATTWTGFAPASSREFRLGNPMVLTAWDSGRFTAQDRAAGLVEELVANIKATPPRQGVDEVLLPGEPEERVFLERSKSGIPLAPATWQLLEEEALRRGIVVSAGN